MRWEICIVFTPEGETVVEAVGFQGPTCARFVDPIARALGGKDLKVSLKPEFHLTAGQHQTWAVRVGNEGNEGNGW